jgi:hypothetical protein
LKKKKVRLQKKNCVACSGKGIASNNYACAPCKGTGHPINKEENKARHPYLVCDGCGNAIEGMILGPDGLFCLECLGNKKLNAKRIDKPTNSDKRKEKLGENISVNSLSKYLDLAKKQKLAFISECSDSKLLREILEHEKGHSKKRQARAIKRIRLLTKS